MITGNLITTVAHTMRTLMRNGSTLKQEDGRSNSYQSSQVKSLAVSLERGQDAIGDIGLQVERARTHVRDFQASHKNLSDELKGEGQAQVHFHYLNDRQIENLPL